jgi:alanine-synthesizing transaminase
MRIIHKSSKLNHVCYDIRGPVLSKAHAMEADGIPITKLNIGNLALFDFEPPPALVHDIIASIQAAAGYSHSKGLLAPRTAIMEHMLQQGVTGITPEDIYLGNGASELIVMSMNALLNPGDEVLVPMPDYPLWTAAVSLSGGTPVHYRCDEQQQWAPDLDHMRRCITPNTRAIVVINPNNPTGALYSNTVLTQIIELARQHQLIIYADEIYSKILYDGATHTPMAALADDIVCITFNGLSKNYRACGYRTGWMVISGDKRHAQDYIAGLDMLASMRLCSNVPGQHAISAALNNDQCIQALVQPGGRLAIQRDLAHQLLTAIPGVSCVKPQAALYLFPRLDPTLYPIKNDRDFIYELLIQEQLLVVQGTGFNWPEPDHLRIVFLPHAHELEDAITRMARFLKKYRHD